MTLKLRLPAPTCSRCDRSLEEVGGYRLIVKEGWLKPERRAWICQSCGDRACKACGSPLNPPLASDVLHDDGAVRHIGIYPVRPKCIRPSCGRFDEGPRMTVLYTSSPRYNRATPSSGPKS